MRYVKPRIDAAYRVTNPTLGTGIGQTIVTAFDATKPLFAIFNTDAAGGLSIWMDYIKLANAVAGASSTSAQFAMVLDTADRYVSGGSRLTTSPGAIQIRSGLATASKARIDFGAVVAAAVAANRQICRDVVKTQAAPCWVVGDEVYIKFDTFDFSPALTSGAATAIFGVPSGPCVIDPGHMLLGYLWHPANAVTAPSWEVEIAWWEQKA